MTASKNQLTAFARDVLTALKAKYPDAGCELHFTTPLELAIAAILAAQCTDARVNEITRPLFQKFSAAKDWVSVPLEELEKMIFSTGYYRNKAKSIQSLCHSLVEDHQGKLPQQLETLITLPGIGRKTANLLVSIAFGQPGMIVDTHFKRVVRRLGFTRSQNPDIVERELCKIVPREDWSAWSDCMVFHGRYCCFARNPSCSECPLADRCPSASNT